MASQTTNYNLVKPAQEDYYDIKNQNDNMDTIDTAMKGLDRNKEAVLKGAIEKATLVDADSLPLLDSADSTKTKKITFNNIKSALKTYFDTLYNKTVIANNLTTTAEGSALDAMQGKVLADSISAVNGSLSEQFTSVSIKIDNIPIASKIVNGLMSKEDKTKLDVMVLQEAVMDLFNAGQAVPWNFIKTTGSSCYGSISSEMMSSITPMPTSGINYAGFCTVNKIKVSDFNYVKFNRGAAGALRLGISYYMALSTDATPSTSGAVAYLSSNADGGDDAINISNLNGEYYIKVLCSSAYTSYGQTGGLNVYKITLENAN